MFFKSSLVDGVRINDPHIVKFTECMFVRGLRLL